MAINKIEKQLKELVESNKDYDSMDIPIEHTENIEIHYPKCNSNITVFPQKGNNPKRLVLTLNLIGGFKTKVNIFDSNHLNCFRELLNNPILDTFTKYTDKINNIDTTKPNKGTTTKKVFEI